MSGWDAYINALKGDGKVITGAAIYGQGSAPALWAASSAGFIQAPEIAALSSGLTNQLAFDSMSGGGFKVGGVKYMKINSELNKVIRGKQGENAAAAALSKKAIVVATGKGSPQEISNAVEKMAADLAGKGF
jgi:hypothetical protein